ncbi:MAG: thiol protease/hemagglutinin PrtT [Bacteroidota bacterium]|nr:thiol protease/hemagglutinin PrtT [Bacteroidota bacterium]
MKYLRFIVSVILFCFSATSFSVRIDQTKALEIAQQFFDSHRKIVGLRSAKPLQLVYTCKDSVSLLRSASPANYFYIFNAGDQDGFVIVSADDVVKPVLGYSDEGSFSVSRLPDNLQSMLDTYKKSISYAMQGGAIEAASTVTADMSSYVKPLLGNIKWDQTSPYNSLCPRSPVDGKPLYTGCVATAMAQIMKYFRWPVSGTGSNTDVCQVGSFTVDFSRTAYQWDKMLDTYLGGTSLPEQDSAVATLMYHCGVAVNMNYMTDGSGASVYDARKALIQNFGYDKDIQYLERANFNAAGWLSLVKTELSDSRPILMANDTHAYAVDGYDSAGYVHVNWGWSGVNNGYFDPNLMGGYGSRLIMLTGIQKENNTTDKTLHLILISQLSPSVDTLSDISSNSASIKASFQNDGTEDFSGTIGLGLYQNGVLVKELATQALSLSTKGMNISKSVTYPVSLKGVTPGAYRIYTIYEPSGATQWNIMNGSTKFQNYLSLTVSDVNGARISVPASNPLLSLSRPIGQSEKNTYYNRGKSFQVSVRNAGNEFYSYVGLKLTAVSNLAVSQYLGCDLAYIAPGDTGQLTLGGTITVAPGTYTAVVVYDSTNTQSVKNYKTLGQSLTVTVLQEPDTAALQVVGPLSFAQGDTIHQNEAFIVHVTLKNTGGFYGNQVVAYIFKKTLGTSISYIDFGDIALETGETETYSFKGSLDLDPGSYYLYLYYAPYGTSLTNLSRLLFTVAGATNLTASSSSGWTIYPNPVVDQLTVASDVPVKQAWVSDLSGRTLLHVLNRPVLSVGHLRSGVYLIRVETEKGIRTEKIVKQ